MMSKTLDSALTAHNQQTTHPRAHTIDSFTATMMCLVVVLSFGLGYSLGKGELAPAQLSTTTDHAAYGRMGRMANSNRLP